MNSSEELELKKKIERGNKAEQILKDPLIKEAIQNMKNTVYHNIETSSYRQTKQREELYRMLKTIDHFQSQFEQMVNGKKKAESMLQALLNKARGV